MSPVRKILWPKLLQYQIQSRASHVKTPYWLLCLELNVATIIFIYFLYRWDDLYHNATKLILCSKDHHFHDDFKTRAPHLEFLICIYFHILYFKTVVQSCLRLLTLLSNKLNICFVHVLFVICIMLYCLQHIGNMKWCMQGQMWKSWPWLIKETTIILILTTHDILLKRLSWNILCFFLLFF